MKKTLLRSGLFALAITAVLLLTAQTTVNGRKDGFNAVVTVSTATTLQSLQLPISSTRPMYITDIEFGSSVASSTAADSFPTLKMGNGASPCGSNTAVIWQAMTAANTTAVTTLTTPIKVTKGFELCWIHSGTGSKTIQVHGFWGADNE